MAARGRGGQAPWEKGLEGTAPGPRWRSRAQWAVTVATLVTLRHGTWPQNKEYRYRFFSVFSRHRG